MEQYLILNNDTKVENSHALTSMNDLFVYIRDEEYDIKKVFDTFYDEDVNAKIRFFYYGAELVFEGYTKLVAVREEVDSSYTVVLRKTA